MTTVLSKVAPSSVRSCLQPFDRCVPVCPVRRVVAPLEVLECRFVGTDHASARARFDAHVADRHPAFHVESPDCRAGELDHVTGAAARADLCAERQNDVLGCNTRHQLPFDSHLEGLCLPLQEALRGQNVLHLARADAKRQCAKRAMGRRMAVATHNRLAGLREAALRSDHVDDAVPAVSERVELDTKLLAVALQLAELCLGLVVDHPERLRQRRCRMVHRRDGFVRAPNLEPALAKACEGLR